MNKKILLTGATGFLGSHLLESFITQGFDVAILKRATSDDWRIIHLLNEVKIFNIDKITLKEVFNEFKPDIIVHTACNYGRNNEALIDIIKTNLIFAVDLLEHAVLNNTSTFINTDSLLPRSINNYSLSKSQFSDWLQKYSDQIQCVNFKIEHMYGIRDDRKKFIPWIIEEMIYKNDIINLTSGIQMRDFVYVSDVVAAFNLVIQKRGTLNAWNEFEIGTNDFTQVKKLVLKLASILEKKFDKIILPRLKFGSLPYRKEEIMVPNVNNSKLISLGLDSFVTIDQGLKKIIKEYK